MTQKSLLAKFTDDQGRLNVETLPELPYSKTALKVVSEQTLNYHYGKHLAAYLNNTNNLKKGSEYENMPLTEIIQKAQGGLFNNAAQTFNHIFYFEGLKEYAEDSNEAKGKVLDMIKNDFQDFAKFKEDFSKAAATLFGSGWVWLVLNENGKLEIMQTFNADCPLKVNKKPLLCIDVWEHAYYLDTQNARPTYIENFWKIVDWDMVEARLA